MFFKNFGAGDFPFKIPFESALFFFLLWRRDPVLELRFLMPLRVVLLCFATRSVELAL